MIKPGWEDRFFAAYRQCGNVRAATQAAGVTRDAAFKRRREDPKFAARWETAHEEAVDLLEAVAWKRATVEQSDRMLELLLKANRPDKYAERLILLRRIADEVKSSDDADLLSLLGYEPGTGDQAPAGAGGAPEAREAAAADGD